MDNALKTWWTQIIFVGTLIFASGTFYANVQANTEAIRAIASEQRAQSRLTAALASTVAHYHPSAGGRVQAWANKENVD